MKHQASPRKGFKSMCVCVCDSHSVLSNSLRPHGLKPAWLLYPWEEYWSGLPCLPPGALLDPGIEPMSLVSPALAGGFFTTSATWNSLVAQTVKSLQGRNPGLIPGSGRSPGERNGNPLQYSCLENSMDRRAWWATVDGVAKSRTGLKQLERKCATREALLRV